MAREETMSKLAKILDPEIRSRIEKDSHSTVIEWLLSIKWEGTDQYIFQINEVSNGKSK